MNKSMEWPISELARFAGITSRTLRHYHQVGLLVPSSIAASGERYYDQLTLVRLQRILLLRDLGMPLADISQVVDQQTDEIEALRTHVQALKDQRAALDRKLRTVEQTIAALTKGAPVKAEEAFDGFNEQYREEVIERWGQKAYEDSDRWWRDKSTGEQQEWMDQVNQLSADWVAAWERGENPTGDAGQQLAARHVEWLASVPGTPGAEGEREQTAQMVRGLGSMYVSDPRFAANYGGVEGAAFVRDALEEYVRTHLEPGA